jgi:hypothetical protein
MEVLSAMSPIALSDSELEAVYRAAGPIPPAVRPAFFELVAQSLAGAGEIGDGTVARVCAEVQRAALDSPGSLALGRLEQVSLSPAPPGHGLDFSRRGCAGALRRILRRGA